MKIEIEIFKFIEAEPEEHECILLFRNNVCYGMGVYEAEGGDSYLDTGEGLCAIYKDDDKWACPPRLGGEE